MKVAIMQPYFAPYIGYFQLIAAVDVFVVLDDVNYIKGGWINRNKVLCHGKPTWLTVPLQGASPNKKISELEIAPDNGWKKKMLTLFKQSYATAPNGEMAIGTLQNWLAIDDVQLSGFIVGGITEICNKLGIKTEIIPTSTGFQTEGLRGADRVLKVCNELGATDYINAPGGRSLYSSQDFADHGFKLGFLNPAIPNLPGQPPEAGTLSILHLLAHGVGREFPRGKVDFDDNNRITE